MKKTRRRLARRRRYARTLKRDLQEWTRHGNTLAPANELPARFRAPLMRLRAALLAAERNFVKMVDPIRFFIGRRTP